MNIPVEKGEEVVEVDKPIQAIVTDHEGRGTRFRITKGLNYLVGSEVDWKVCRLSSNEFLIAVPSMEVLNFLRRIGRIKFTCSDIQALVQETDRDFDSFDALHIVWVRARGIPKIAKKEQHVMELAYLVGDTEEVHLESLNWKDVWIKVACKNLKAIKVCRCGASPTNRSARWCGRGSRERCGHDQGRTLVWHGHGRSSWECGGERRLAR